MKKSIIITSSIVVVLLIAIFVFILSSKTSLGFDVTLKYGDVNVLTKNDEWIKITEQENFFKELKAIKTNDGEALLTIKKSTLITVEPNTEINVDEFLIKEDVKIQQTSGTSWSKFLGIMGVNNYDVETAHTVASVRGTGFYTNITNNASIFMLGEGELYIKDWNQTLQPFQKVIIYENKTIVLENLTEEEIEFLKSKMKEDLINIKSTRQSILDNNNGVIRTVQKLTNSNDEDMNNLLNDIDEGIVDDKEKVKESPIPLPSDIDIVLEINQKIKEQIQLIKYLVNETQ